MALKKGYFLLAATQTDVGGVEEVGVKRLKLKAVELVARQQSMVENQIRPDTSSCET
jgi:hypothetical protein